MTNANAADIVYADGIQESLYIPSDLAKELQDAIHAYRYTCGQGMDRHLPHAELVVKRAEALAEARARFEACLETVRFTAEQGR